MDATAGMIPVFDLEIPEADLDAVAVVLRDGGLGTGRQIAAFEEAFAARLGCRHAVAVASCTSALHLAYRAVGVSPGDEVIVPSFTFVATAAAVRYCGATPVFADVLNPSEPTIDPAHVRALITPRTRAIACLHYAGYAARIADLRALADEHGLALVEDAAHAPSGTAPDGRSLGAIGDVGCFSFFSNKVLAAGEGGLLVTDDDAIASRARADRSHGLQPVPDAPSDVRRPSLNHRWDDGRATLALARLRRLDADVGRRRALTRRYRAHLAEVPGVQAPFSDEAVGRSACYAMPIMLDDPDRQGPLRRTLREQHGIQTSLVYPAVHEFTAYGERTGSLAQTEACARRVVCLPLFAHLDEADQDRVTTAIARELRTA